jgi:hypothetical protein
VIAADATIAVPTLEPTSAEAAGKTVAIEPITVTYFTPAQTEGPYYLARQQASRSR